MVKILAIDDQQDNLLVLNSIIQDLLPETTVITSQSGIDGIEKAKSDAPDVILLDIIMPGMDGFEVCRLLKEKNCTKHIPIIMITAIRTDSDSRIKGLELGADAFLSKPIDETELVAQIKVMLRIKKSEDILRSQKKELQEIVHEKTSELKTHKISLELILGGTDEGIWDWDLQSGTINYNDNWKNILGYESSDTNFNMDWWLNSTEDQTEANFNKALTDYLERESKYFDLEYRIKDNFGKWKWICARGIGVAFDNQGKLLQIQGTLRDITDRKQAEEKIHSSLKEKETLLQEIHHRVKNNMQVVSSLLSLQAAESGNNEVQEALNESKNRVLIMASIHESLYMSDNISEIELKPFFNKIAKTLLYSYAVEPNRIKLTIVTENINVDIQVATPLGLIINELVSNALKYAFPNNMNGEISIDLRRKNNTLVELTIQDTGIGFPAEFDWKNANSLGLKLLITLVENQLEGSVELDSKKGSRFIINFPL